MLTAFACANDSDTRYQVYIAEESDTAAANAIVSKVLPQNAAYEVCVLPTNGTTYEEAEQQAKAMREGVHALPCLVISVPQQAPAVILLKDLTEKTLKIAQQAENSATAEEMKRRDLAARIFLICASLSIKEQDEATLEATVTECRHLLEHPQVTDEQRQFIGYRCLYPALLLQYRKAYTGAHTPYTEAKLLEAIAALETARDLNRNTKIGKQAFAERERLRRARREARKYE